MKIAIYARVSKADGSQDTKRQIDDLRKFARERGWSVEKEVVEHVSGRMTRRQGTAELVKLARGNRIQKVLVHEISRLGRNMADVVATVEELSVVKVSVYVHHQGLETLDDYMRKTPYALMVLPILAGVAEQANQEHSMRIKSGLERARKKGKILGRPAGGPIKQEKEIRQLLAEGQSISEIARRLKMSRTTVRKVRILT